MRALNPVMVCLFIVYPYKSFFPSDRNICSPPSSRP